MNNLSFWKDKRVFLTGHTGFKGTWLSLWLTSLGARVTGYSLPAPTDPCLFELSGCSALITESITGDITDFEKLRSAMVRSDPEIIFHLAAQAIVTQSYADPRGTFATNVIGTVNLLEGAKLCPAAKTILAATSDKCYRIADTSGGYREDHPLGGFDPYSGSKACAEIVCESYAKSVLAHASADRKLNINVVTARAGNVIGEGDWAANRLVPDLIRAALSGSRMEIRNPDSVRSWIYVLDVLYGYLLLARETYLTPHAGFLSCNFAREEDACPVRELVAKLSRSLNVEYSVLNRESSAPEADRLILNSSAARERLGWKPLTTLDQSMELILRWVSALRTSGDLQLYCFNRLTGYQKLINGA